jgi:hypothetical protein
MWTPWYPGSNDHNLQLLTVEVLMTDNDSERVSAPLRAALAEFGDPEQDARLRQPPNAISEAAR